jgi:hypothetical protein
MDKGAINSAAADHFLSIHDPALTLSLSVFTIASGTCNREYVFSGSTLEFSTGGTIAIPAAVAIPFCKNPNGHVLDHRNFDTLREALRDQPLYSATRP